MTTTNPDGLPELTASMCPSSDYAKGWNDARAALAAPAASAKYCSDERPCTPCFSNNGPCEDAPAASGVDTSTNEAWAARAQEKIEAMDAASVSERARESVAMELLTNIKRSCQRGRNVADPIKDKSYVESCDHIEDLAQQAIRQIEILSNRPSESTVKRLRDAIEGECDGLGITEESAESILRYIGFHPQGRIVGGREIDGVWVIEATSHSELMPNQQLVRYDDYRAALEQALTQQRAAPPAQRRRGAGVGEAGHSVPDGRSRQVR